MATSEPIGGGQAQHLHRHPGEHADEEAVDLSMLQERLRLTPTERLERHRAALKFVLDLQEAASRSTARHA